ncbi:MAG: helix-hairpin-helix domain-containing protein, partial [Bacteroidales bacterium]|nr:helix-hairpin-helix domain-containing protein [Bacteroidales bacterium]
MRREKQEKLSKSAASGLVALVFLILGFQLALFVVKVVERPAESPVEPEVAQSVADSVPQVKPAASPPAPKRSKYGGYERPASAAAPKRTRPREPERSYESFAFDPNTVSVADLQRLGLSERQAQSIENYREKGGRFRSKADFQKMYVVSDTLFARLEPYIEIAKLELNGADSAALVSLRGIGPWYARKILDYRDRLGGFV